MSGIVEKDAPYTVPRAEVEPVWGSLLTREQEQEFTDEEKSSFNEGYQHLMQMWIKPLFPQYSRWCTEAQSPFGDKSKACKNFLYKVIPYLTHVILTDGPFWIRYYPNHEVSRLLRAALPPDTYDQ